MDHLVIVTGGSSGLGRALIDTAPDGSMRVDVSRRGHGGGDVRHVAADLAQPTAWAEVGEVIEELVSERNWDRISLIHNAGTLTPIGFVGEQDSNEVTANVLLNSASGQVLGHMFLAAVRDRTSRRELVMITSGAARRAVAGWATYGAGKAAYDHWVRTVAEEQAERGGAMVVSISPGLVATGMQAEIREASKHDFPNVPRFRDFHDAGALQDPVETAGRVWARLDDPKLTAGSVVDLRDRD